MLLNKGRHDALLWQCKPIISKRHKFTWSTNKLIATTCDSNSPNRVLARVCVFVSICVAVARNFSFRLLEFQHYIQHRTRALVIGFSFFASFVLSILESVCVCVYLETRLTYIILCVACVCVCAHLVVLFVYSRFKIRRKEKWIGLVELASHWTILDILKTKQKHISTGHFNAQKRSGKKD